MSPRIANVVLGVWLFISAFLWPHSAMQFTNTWIVGLLIAAIAFVAMKYADARYLNAALSVWLFISAWALPRLSMATLWNNAIVALAVFFVSLVPAARYITPGPPRTGPTVGPPV